MAAWQYTHPDGTKSGIRLPAVSVLRCSRCDCRFFEIEVFSGSDEWRITCSECNSTLRTVFP